MANLPPLYYGLVPAGEAVEPRHTSEVLQRLVRSPAVLPLRQACNIRVFSQRILVRYASGEPVGVSVFYALLLTSCFFPLKAASLSLSLRTFFFGPTPANGH